MRLLTGQAGAPTQRPAHDPEKLALGFILRAIPFSDRSCAGDERVAQAVEQLTFNQ